MRRVALRSRWVTADRARSVVPPWRRLRPARPSALVEVVDERVELGAGSFGSGEVVIGVGLVDVVLEVSDAGLVLAAGARVDHLAGVGLERAGTGELDAVDLAAGLGEQHGQVVHAPRRREVDGEPVVGDLPQVPGPHEAGRRLAASPGGRSGRGRVDRRAGLQVGQAPPGQAGRARPVQHAGRRGLVAPPVAGGRSSGWCPAGSWAVAASSGRPGGRRR